MIQVPAEGPVAGRDDGPTDLDSLLGLRSVKRSFFDQYRAAESRLRRSMHALDRVSGALVRTADGPEELMRSVLRVAYDQLDAQWGLVALRDGQLPSVEPRHLLIDPEGATSRRCRTGCPRAWSTRCWRCSGAGVPPRSPRPAAPRP